MSLDQRCQKLKEKLDQTDPGPVKETPPAKAFSVGIELVASFITALLVSWGIGQLFGLSSLARVLLGFIWGVCANGLILYKLAKK